MTQVEKQLIDRYLENTLTGIELKKFIDKLETNEEFRKQVSFHNLLIEAIQEAEDKRLKISVEKFIGYKRPFIPLALKLIVTFLVITTGGIVLWNYVGPDSTGKRHNYFSLDFFNIRKGNADSLQVSEDKSPKIKKQVPKNYTLQVDNSNDEGEAATIDSVEKIQPDEPEIFVKKDQLLICVSLKPLELKSESTKDDNSESSIAKNTSDKLNPSGGLPDYENSKIENYSVEFWVSPVNYKGYKLIKDRLILFGIEEPDAVQLISKDDKLWMKYGQDYYSLVPSEVFESFTLTNEKPSAEK